MKKIVIKICEDIIETIDKKVNKKLENCLIQEFKDEKFFFSSINISQIKYKIQENNLQFLNY